MIRDTISSKVTAELRLVDKEWHYKVNDSDARRALMTMHIRNPILNALHEISHDSLHEESKGYPFPWTVTESIKSHTEHSIQVLSMITDAPRFIGRFIVGGVSSTVDESYQLHPKFADKLKARIISDANANGNFFNKVLQRLILPNGSLHELFNHEDTAVQIYRRSCVYDVDEILVNFKVGVPATLHLLCTNPTSTIWKTK